ncbi:MAG: putative metal-binding motif-containing protein [Alphaproteobacteria bacterium]|nr:putative metal-binding motif-containing protein [Alphaproteobacteria bacterium]MCB9691948.1 putative metal-binding motif-containing protein [Alphaproteobacteria bacterium]
MRAPWLLALVASGCIIDADIGEPQDDDRDGFALGEDCDDTDPDVNPEAVEVCDAVDNDCNDAVDDQHVCDRTVSFRQASTLDVLLVIDDSSSMLEFQERMADGLAELLAPITGLDADTHVGVVTMDMDDPLASGRLRSYAGERWIASNTPAEEVAVWTDGVLLAGEAGSGTEAGVDAAIAALTTHRLGANDGFRRLGAHLTVIALTSEADQSAATLDDALDALSSVASSFTWHAIVPTGDLGCMDGLVAQKHVDLATLTGGTSRSICTPEFGGFLDAIGQISAQEGLQRRFLLPGTAEPGSVQVDVVLPTSNTVRPLDPDEINLSSDATEVVLVNPPPAGSAITIRYRHLPPRIP